MSYSIAGTNVIDSGGALKNIRKVNPLSSTQETYLEIGTLTSMASGSSTGSFHFGDSASGGYFSACKDVFAGCSVAKTVNYTNNSYCWFTLAGTGTGSITLSGTNTAYNGFSDYRLKENINPMSSQLENVKSLNPVTFTIKEARDPTKNITGFIAHQLANTYPQFVSGEKDAVDENGDPQLQSVDYRNITAPLTKAIQEAMELIETLEDQNADAEARIAALEAR